MLFPKFPTDLKQNFHPNLTLPGSIVEREIR